MSATTTSPRSTFLPNYRQSHCEPLPSEITGKDDDTTIPSDVGGDWHAVRISRIKSLWKCLCITLFIIGLWIGLERQFLCLVASNPSDWSSCRAISSPEQKQEDYGLFYRAAYAVAYVSICVLFPMLMAIYYAWTIPSSLARSLSLLSPDPGHGGVLSPSQREVVEGIDGWIMMFNRGMFSVAIGVQAVSFLCFLYAVLWYKDEVVGVLERNDSRRTSWKERNLLCLTAGLTVLVGLYVHWVMEITQLGQVKSLEHWLIVVPAEVVIGIMVATKLQRRWERREREGGLQ